MISELVESSLFTDTEISVLDDILTFSKRKECEDGDVLIEENSTGSFDVFILCEGKVEVVSSSSSSASSEVVISSQEKDELGEISWLLRMRRTATVRCIGEGIVIQIDGDKLMEYFEANKEIGYQFMKKISILLAKRLLNTDDLLKQLLWNV